MTEMQELEGFAGRLWKEEINVRQFVQDNYAPYGGDEALLQMDFMRRLFALAKEKNGRSSASPMPWATYFRRPRRRCAGRRKTLDVKKTPEKLIISIH